MLRLYIVRCHLRFRGTPDSCWGTTLQKIQGRGRRCLLLASTLQRCRCCSFCLRGVYTHVYIYTHMFTYMYTSTYTFFYSTYDHNACQASEANAVANHPRSPRGLSPAMRPFAEAAREDIQVVRHVSVYVRVFYTNILAKSMSYFRGSRCCAASAFTTRTLTCNASICRAYARGHTIR